MRELLLELKNTTPKLFPDIHENKHSPLILMLQIISMLSYSDSCVPAENRFNYALHIQDIMYDAKKRQRKRERKRERYLTRMILIPTYILLRLV